MTPATAERYAKYRIRQKKEELQREYNMLEYHASFHGVKFEAPNLLEEPDQPGDCKANQKEKCETLHKGFLGWVCENCDARS